MYDYQLPSRVVVAVYLVTFGPGLLRVRGAGYLARCYTTRIGSCAVQCCRPKLNAGCFTFKALGYSSPPRRPTHAQAMPRVGDLTANAAAHAGAQDDPVRGWVRGLMQALNTDPTGLARLADINQSILSRFMNGRTAELGPSTLHALARVATIPTPGAVQATLDRPQHRRRTRDAALTPSGTMPAGVAQELPVWGVHPWEPDGEFYLNPVPVQVLQRPATMAGSRRMACFYAPDETMAPRWQMGEPVVVDLMRPPTQGAVALVKLANERQPNGDETFLLRRYDGRDGDCVLLSQLTDAPGALRLRMTRILEMRRVLGWSEFLFR